MKGKSGEGMKKKMKKHLLMLVLVVCTIVSATLATNAEESTTEVKKLDGGAVSQQIQDITSYRKAGDFKAPDAPEGYSDYVFAGWYTDAACTKANALGKNVTSDTIGEDKSAYAKFVPEEVLSVRAQVIGGTTYASEKSNIRFVTTVDSLNYESVGFDFVRHDGTKLSGESDEVYKKLYVLDSNGKVMNYTPWNVFHSMSKYFMACNIRDVANEDFGHGITATPYWITLDGTKVEGVTATKTINMGYMPLMTGVTAASQFSLSRVFGLTDITDPLSAQGGCTDGTYYYQAFIKSSDTVDDTAAKVYIRKYNLTNGEDDVSDDLNLHHANDITYNPDLKYGNRTGLLVVIHNTPVYTRLSFINPDDLKIVDPSEITDLNDTPMSWEWPEGGDGEYLDFSTASIIKGGIYSMEYNSTHKKYVVGLSGRTSTNWQKFTFLDENMAEIGDIHQPSQLTYNFTTQGNAADDGYIYFILHHKEFVDDTPLQYDTHVISVYDWDGNFVTVLQIPSISVDNEVENISIYNNDIYIGTAGSGTLNASVYKVSELTYPVGETVASIERDGKTIPYVSLEAAMMDAEADETITVLKNVEVSSPMEMVNKNVTLTNTPGVDVTISRRAAYTGINVINNSAKNFTIKSNTTGSLTFDGTGTQRGASWIVNSVDGELTLENVTVQNVLANQEGGAVCAKSGTVTINGCTFKNNQNSKNGGAIYSSAAVTVNNSVFESNSAANGGAIYNYTKKVTINACTFGGVDVGNSATSSGGAIYSGGSGTVELLGNEMNPVFEENHASGGYGGGAICIGSGTLTVNEYKFKNNTANVQGGAIALRGSSDNTITNSIFDGNDAEGVVGNAESGNGGAIHNRGTKPTIRDCEFTGNTALRTGGALYNETTGVVTMLAVGEDLYAKAALFSGNKAGSGGAIAAVAGTVTVNGYTFDANEAEKKVIGTETTTDENEVETTTDVYSDAQGGAIYAKSATVGTTDCVFTANESAAHGGAIFNGSSAKTTVTDTKFQQNKAGNDGGAIYNGATLTLKGTKGAEETVTAVFDNNGFIDGTDPDSARGAAIYNGSTLNATAYVFKNNVTTGNGGAICNYGSNPKFTNCQFISNQGAIGGAVYSGGGNKIYFEVSAEAPELTALCEGNIATTRGGAIGVGYGHTYVDGYEFKSNHAPYGGAIYLQNLKETKDDEDNTITVGTDSSITNSIFVGNYTNETGGTTGGAVQVDNGTVDIETSTFNQNSSTTHGGAIYTKAVTGIDGCTFTSNHATSQGGAIKVEGSTAQLNITKTTFGGSEETLGNTAGASGGAIYNAGSATTTVGTENGAKQATEVFANNRSESEYGGGAICIGTGSLMVYGYTFNSNYATVKGGAIAHQGKNTFIIKNALFESNKSAGLGGAITTNATTTIDDSQFNMNESTGNSGGAISIDSITVEDKVVVRNSTFDQNKATSGSSINMPGGTYLTLENCQFTNGTTTNINTNQSVCGFGDIRLGDNSATGGVKISGKIVADIHFNQAGPLKVSGALTEGSDVVANWRKDKVIGDTFTGINFASEEVMNASKGYITLSDNQNSNYIIDFAETTGTLLKATKVATAEELDAAFTAISSSDDKTGIIVLTDDITIAERTEFPTDCTITVRDDGTARSFIRSADYTGYMLSVPSSANVTFVSTSKDNTNPSLMIDGGNVACTAGNTLLENNGTLTVNQGVALQNNQTSGNNQGIALYSQAGSNTTFKGAIRNITSTYEGDSHPSSVAVKGAVTFENAVVENNVTNRNGMLRVFSGGSLTANNTEFKNNTAGANGGAFNIESGAGTVSFTGCTFTNNHANGGDGGAIYNYGADTNITNCIFNTNTASARGGAIYSGGSVTVDITGDGTDNSIFSNNAASGAYGGAIAIGSGKLVIENYKFDTNTAAAGQGGAVCVTGSGSNYSTITSCNFISNSAKEGGALHVGNSGKVTVNTSEFTTNSATTNGGAVSNNGGGAFNIYTSTFTTNSTTINGGAIYVNCTGTVLVEGTTFYNNSTTGNSGGAMYVTSIGVVTVNTSEFNDNHAKNKGGAMCTEGGKVTFNTCNFIDNDAKSDGGAIRMAGNNGSSNVEINGGEFKNNVSGGAGGAIKLNTGTLKVTGVVFTGNTATGGGNALSTNGAGATLSGCTFKESDISGEYAKGEEDNTLVTEE